jgi:hypothetical protein
VEGQEEIVVVIWIEQPAVAMAAPGVEKTKFAYKNF